MHKYLFFFLTEVYLLKSSISILFHFCTPRSALFNLQGFHKNRDLVTLCSTVTRSLKTTVLKDVPKPHDGTPHNQWQASNKANLFLPLPKQTTQHCSHQKSLSSYDSDSYAPSNCSWFGTRGCKACIWKHTVAPDAYVTHVWQACLCSANTCHSVDTADCPCWVARNPRLPTHRDPYAWTMTSSSWQTDRGEMNGTAHRHLATENQQREVN